MQRMADGLEVCPWKASPRFFEFMERMASQHSGDDSPYELDQRSYIIGWMARMSWEIETSSPVTRRPPVTSSQQVNLLAQLGPYCQGCGGDFSESMLELQVDHICPKSNGGTDMYHNLTLLCSFCNQLKGDRLTLTGLQSQNRSSGRLTSENEGNIYHTRETLRDLSPKFLNAAKV